MDSETHKQKAGVIKALGHPSRLAIVEYLVDGERCVCDLQALVGSDISTVSKHLSVLKSAGLVCDRKEGQWVYYRLRTPCIIGFLDCVEGVTKDTCECEQCLAAREA